MNLNFTKSGSHAEYGCQDIGEAVSVLYSEMAGIERYPLPAKKTFEEHEKGKEGVDA